MSKIYIGKSKATTSWQNVSTWYNQKINQDGSYFHQHVVIPNILRIINQASSLLDLACGQGILERKIDKNMYYQGIDASADLIKFGNQHKISKQHHFQTADITRPLPISKFDFSIATIILALQNIASPDKVIIIANQHLVKNGKLIIVINHPCFRIPKNTSWGIDKKQSLQYRRIDRYLSLQKTPILMHPGQRDKSPQTWSYHFPLSYLSKILGDGGFVITSIEEWISDKTSDGKNAEMENLARKEFPLFMAIVAQKTNQT